MLCGLVLRGVVDGLDELACRLGRGVPRAHRELRSARHARGRRARSGRARSRALGPRRAAPGRGPSSSGEEPRDPRARRRGRLPLRLRRADATSTRTPPRRSSSRPTGAISRYLYGVALLARAICASRSSRPARARSGRSSIASSSPVIATIRRRRAYGALHRRVHARRRRAHPASPSAGLLRACSSAASAAPARRGRRAVNEFLRRILFLPPQASTVARDIDQLHYFVILTTMAGAVAGHARRRLLPRPLPPPRPHARRRAPTPTPARAPAMRLKVGASSGSRCSSSSGGSSGFAQYVRLRVAPEGAMDVYVTAKQWMWKFAYPEGARSIARLYVPAGRPVKLVMTSRDVIHSFFVPDFRVKQDVVPGPLHHVWFEAVAPGTYPILCTAVLRHGPLHDARRGRGAAPRATSSAGSTASRSPRAARIAGPRYEEPQLGLTDAAPARARQHGAPGRARRGGAGLPALPHARRDTAPRAHLGRALRRDGAARRAATEVVADEAYLTESMMDPMAKIHRGYPPHHALVPRPARRRRDGGDRRAHQVAPGRGDQASPPETPPPAGTTETPRWSLRAESRIAR